jgi:uncharacterized protein YoxC
MAYTPQNLMGIPKCTSLESAIEACEVLFALHNGEAYVAIMDANKIGIRIWDTPRMPFGVRVGEPAPEKTVVVEAFNARKLMVKYVDAAHSPFGFAYRGYGLPVFDKQGNILGAISFTLAASSKQTEMQNITNGLREVVERTLSSTQTIVQSTDENVQKTESLSSKVQGIQENVGTIADVARFIREISEQTHLLGLNASIESARAGEMGKGFAVVSQEIRQLAASIKLNMKAMNEKLQQITSDVSVIAPEIQSLKENANQQFGLVQSIDAEMRYLMEVSQSLEQMSKDLVN